MELEGQFLLFTIFTKIVEDSFLRVLLELEASSHILSAFELARSRFSYLTSMMKMCSYTDQLAPGVG